MTRMYKFEECMGIYRVPGEALQWRIARIKSNMSQLLVCVTTTIIALQLGKSDKDNMTQCSFVGR